MRGLISDGLGDTAAERLSGLADLSDGALAERLFALALHLREVDARALAEAAGLPLAEVVASPFALRMVAMGVAAGASSRPRELRRLIDWTQTIDPAVGDPDHDVWERGVLKTGKYQGFTAESPIAVYDPAHVSKWGPHEMLHRAVGFFHREGMTRWELYLGARLNELLPVTTFYGAEQTMRLDEPRFDREAAGRAPRATLVRARWRVEDEAELRRRALASAPIFRDGLVHLHLEQLAIDHEMCGGVRVRAPHPFLDTSSDATAYVVGHFERLRQTAVTQALAPRAVDSIDRYRDQVLARFDALLFADLSETPDPERQREAEAHDLLLRAAHLGEGVEVDLEPLMGERDPDVIRERLPERIGREEAALVLADGSPKGLAVDQLDEGLAQAMPRTHALLPDLAERLAEHLPRRGALHDRGPLAERVCRGLGPEGDVQVEAGVESLAALEHMIASARRDDAIEWLATPEDELPEALDQGEVFAHGYLEELRSSHDVLRAHAEGGAPSPGPQTLLVVGYQDAVSVVPIPPEVAEHFHRPLAHASWHELDPTWLRELIAAGVLGWRPRR